ncbi:hypothetical protein Tco_0856704 [Tanacetum coccineum]|uniref:Integrase, catalytic region, zinc finger, CCHC-type, peptidase aspartic, catalytic n=1 Tax=Tanacetum coccineum TaxID=301880 RepID=A0ABQ5B687_9ASTR
MTKQERKSMLYDEFDKFTSELGESIHSYYLRYAKLINDMNTIPMSMTPIQIDTKFVNHLQPEWSRFVTTAKQASDLHSVTFDQLYAFLKHNEKDAKEVREMRQRFPEPLALLANTCNPPPLYSSQQIQCHMAKKCTARKRMKDSEWFKEKMLLAESQEAGVADHVDAYDSDCDDEATTNAIFMANLSPVGSLNDDMVAPRYDSVTLSEVPHYDTYHDYDVLNSNIQELEYIENIVSNNKSYDELKGNNDVISYIDYMLTIRSDEENYVPPPVQKNDVMLSVIEQMKSQVEKCNKVNQEAKSVNESLTSELKRYKDRVRVLEYAVKDGHSEQESYISRELYTLISQCKLQVSEFEKQVFSQQTQIKDLNNHIAFLKKNFETLKQESSEKYKKNISEIVDLEKAKKELENIVFKVGQSAQTMHMLTKPQIFYDETHNTNLGYQNPLYLSQARRIQKIEDENASIAFQVSSLVKEREHIKLEYKKLYDSIKQTWEKMKLQTDSLQQKHNDQIYENNKLRAQLKGNGNEKWAPATSHKRNNKPYIDAWRTKQTIKTITKDHAVKQNTYKNDNTMLPSTGRVSSTNASGSNPRSNTKNDRIPQLSSRSMKNKVEAYHRKFKSSANKNNHDSDCNVNVKNVTLSKNSDTICLSCNKCLFSINHDACVV